LSLMKSWQRCKEKTFLRKARCKRPVSHVVQAALR
jgi:hypothetical protein